MSKQHKREVSSCQDVEDSLRRTDRTTYDGVVLSKRDDQTYKSGLCAYHLVMYDLLCDRTPNRVRRLKPWILSLAKADVALLARFLKSATSYFRHYVEGERCGLDDFKHRFRNEFPIVGDFMSPITEEVRGFLEAPNPSDFLIINQHLSFLGRLTLQDVGHEARGLSEYLANEERLVSHKHDYALYDDLNIIMREWLHDLQLEEFVPKHGNGAIAFHGRCSLYEKYTLLRSDPLIRYFLKRCGLDDEDVFPLRDSHNHPFDPNGRVCQVTFVPKSMSSCRTISMEPATLMYIQQGVWGSLDVYLHRHSYLRRHLRIHDQSWNRDLAALASRDVGSFATIDLSSASDSVSWEIVKSVFAGTPMLAAAYATRSRIAKLPNGDFVPLQKFAPMGSALCFPVESLIFCAICESAKRKLGYRDASLTYRVYGDDIIVRTEMVPLVVQYLHSCGFTLNTEKTFYHPHNPFRESCGGEYYYGTDVTPFRISRKFSAEPPSRHSPSVYENHIALANIAGQFGLMRTRQWFIHRLLSLPAKYQPLFSVDGRHLYSPNPTNFHLRKIWFDWWQEDLYNYGEISTKSEGQESSDSSETIRLYEWFRLANGRARLDYPEDAIRSDVTKRLPCLTSVLKPLNDLEVPYCLDRYMGDEEQENNLALNSCAL